MKSEQVMRAPDKKEKKRNALQQIIRSSFHWGKGVAIQGMLIAFLVEDAVYDFMRYLRHSNSIFYSTGDHKKFEAALFFYYHKIEKGLSLPEVKPLFGLSYIETVINLVREWADHTGDVNAAVFQGAYAALRQYKEVIGPALQQARPAVYHRLEQLIEDFAYLQIDNQRGGTLEISAKDEPGGTKTNSFEALMLHRHSVRVFTNQPIPDAEIDQAVQLAQRTPSVCNRQCWQVHVFSSPSDKAKILQHQNGNEGFGHLADRVILLTSDLRSFLTNGERNQASVDGGMFAMSLILAFEEKGIASCCLNLCLSSKQEKAFRKTAQLPIWEKPIMLIVVGYPPEDLKVAVSGRKPTASMLNFRDLTHEISVQEANKKG